MKFGRWRVKASGGINALALLCRDRSMESRQSRYRRYYGVPFLFFFVLFLDKYGAVLHRAEYDPPISCRTRRRLSALGQWITKIRRTGETAGKAKTKKQPRGSGVLVRLHDVSTSGEGRFIHPWPSLSAVTRGFNYNHNPVYFHRGFNVGRAVPPFENLHTMVIPRRECRTSYNVT